MISFSSHKAQACLVILFWLLSNVPAETLHAQSFSQNNVNFNGKGSLSSATSLMFGPDGRLYVTEYTGKVKIFTIERQDPGNYLVLSTEVLNDIQLIQDYNDDGSIHSSTNRETIGLTVAGTAANPVIYVTSSDYRIGGGGGGGNGDIGLDTNSGIITRFSWNGTAWEVVDIVRGLPRSEENHATNGLEFVTVNGTDYLIVAQGGHTNAGSPSVNFAYTTEYALSAALLSVNLDMLNAMPILDDNGRKYVYDLPTLDDPSRPNRNGVTDPDSPGYDGIDVNDPFGGNDGLNQAVVVPGGPVQIFSPGYRNAYDLVVTESGAVYVTDNGANGGWGGLPVNEGGGNANNDYDPNEPGSSSLTSDGEKINNKDHLTLVTLDIQNYIFGSFYGGHPCPTRANPEGSGLYVNPSVTGNTGAVFRTVKYDPDGSTPNSTTNAKIALPANWPPVPMANSKEGDWRGPELANPDGPIDAIVTSWGTNTNGIDEYTASNFNGAMKGNLIAGVNTGELRRVELKADGSLSKLTPSFASGMGGNALGVTCNSDSDPFPGTIWVGTLSGALVVLEPQDFISCVQPGDSGYDPLADNDGDGYSNQDEVDNNADPCNGGSQPRDFDKTAGGNLVSDLNDLDDDNDGISDSADPFQLGDPQNLGSDAFSFPVTNELFSDNPSLKGYMGLGMTGLMNNGDPNPNWLNWLDRRDDPNDPNPNDILGGAIGAMTMQMTSGTAMGTVNTQEKGFQYGVKVDQTAGVFSIEGSIVNFDAPLQLYGNTGAPNGELGFFIGDGTQSNYIKFVASKAGITALQELNDSPQTPVHFAIPLAARPSTGITFFFVIDPASGNVRLDYKFDAGSKNVLGTIQAQGAILNAIQKAGADLAVGFIGTSNAEGVELEGTWDYLNVTGSHPFVTKQITDIEDVVGTLGTQIDLDQHFSDDSGVENLTYTLGGNTNPSIAASISGNVLTLGYPSTPAESSITIRATDAQSNFIDHTFKVTIMGQPTVLYRVNAGGSAVAAIDDEMDWEEDSKLNNSAFLLQAGSNKTYNTQKTGYSDEVDQSTTPLSIFSTERYDGSAAPDLQYSFPVPGPGNYQVRLYMGNGFSGTSSPGQRVFDVAIEGIVHPELNNVDLSARFGHAIGGVISKVVEVNDGAINITFMHGVENPLINGIEILGSGTESTMKIVQISDQTNSAGEELSGSLIASASGGDGNLVYSMAGAPAGVNINSSTGVIDGTISSEAATNSPYLVTVKVDDSDTETTDAVATTFTWIINSNSEEVAIEVAKIENQINIIGDELDGSLAVSATGGDGNLTYSMTGGPAGVSIESTNGQIGGTIGLNADTGSPYTVTILVDDEDENNNDAVSTSFTWHISRGEPVVVADIGDIVRKVDASDEVVDLNLYFEDNDGVENLIYSIEANSDPAIGVLISGNLLTLSFPAVGAVSDIKIRATDNQNQYVEQIFRVTVQETASLVLYRVNTGGSFIAAIDDEIDWEEDTPANNSAYLLEPGSNKTYNSNKTSFSERVNQSTTPLGIFNTERYDGKSAPDLEYSFPVPEPGNYEIRLYMGNGYIGTSSPGQRVFDVVIEDIVHPELNNVDLSALFGHAVGGVITKVVEVTDGAINISFVHGVENPLINGIEILGSSVTDSSIIVAQINDQFNQEGDVLDNNLVVSATGGDGDLVYYINGAPAGIGINANTGIISGTIAINAATGSPYTVTVTVDDSDADTEDKVSRLFTWTIMKPGSYTWTSKDENENYTARHECSFVQAGDKFYLMGGRESATTVDVYDYTSNTWISLVNSSPFEFNHFQATEYQGLIWIIGAFQTNNYPTEIPAEHVWAFDPANQEWIRGPQIPAHRQRGSAGLVVYNDKFYVVGGNTIGHDGGYVPWFDQYDPATGVWTPMADAPRARDHFHAAVIGDKLYAVGGRLSGGAGGTFKPLVPQVDVYNFATASWSTLPQAQNIPTPRAAAAVANFNEKLVVIGGEVAGEMVYGVQLDDALRITEEYDPITQSWTRLADLNFERHGTQAIVSGDGIHTIAGSPNRGGGRQKNMEYMGQDAPIGTPSIASTLSVPSLVKVSEEVDADVQLNVQNGNVGIFITSMEITGSNIASFEITDGNLTNALIGPNSSHTLSLAYNGTGESETANLVIKYGASGQVVVNLEGEGSGTGGVAIQVGSITNQSNAQGDDLDGSLVVSATGGDGDLVYSMTGAPSGVTIDSGTGIISGTIAQDAGLESPYTVTVTVDDSDTETTDAVEVTFAWTVNKGEPVIVAQIADILRSVDASEEVLDLNHYFDDNEGVENLTFSVQGNTDPAVGVTVSGSLLTLNFPSVDAVSDVTIRATDPQDNFVEQTFRITVQETNSVVLYRVNAGGPAIGAIDDDMDWEEDTKINNSIFLVEPGRNKTYDSNKTGYTQGVNQSTTPLAIFGSERYDGKSAPDLYYSFPVNEPGNYEVRLYMANGYVGTSSPGQRVFDVVIEGVVHPELDNVDLSAIFGHAIGGMIGKVVEVTDGKIDISFTHGIENPLVNGIEILGYSGTSAVVITAATENAVIHEDFNETGEFNASLFPNPASSEVYVQLSEVSVTIQELQLFDYNGHLLKLYDPLQAYQDEGLYRLDIDGLPDGVYVVHLETSLGTTYNLQLIIKN